MKTTIISVKQLRQNFEMVRAGLTAGRSFTLIYRSRPLAKISPLEELYTPEDETEKIKRNLAKVRKMAGGLKLGKGLTPQQMNRLYDKEVYGKLLRRR